MSDGVVQTGADGSFEQDAWTEEASKVEAAKAELVDEATGERGELIMGKYGSQDELINAFKSLQSEYSKLKGGKPEQPEVQEPVSESAEAEQAEPESQPEPEKEQVSPEQARKIVDAIFQQTGGEQKYHAMAAWAAKSLPDEQVMAFNQAVQSGDVGRAINAVKGLQYDYMTATGYEPRLTGGRAPSGEGPKGFQSEAQVVAAMSDPRYQSGPKQDPAYVAEVEQRLAASAGVFS